MQRMPLKAIFTDMDGTLLNSSHRVSEYTQAVLRDMKQKASAVRLVLVTGRPYPDVLETVQLLGLAPDLIITSNGACMHTATATAAEGGALQFHKLAQHNIPAEVVKRLVNVNVERVNGNADADDVRTVATCVFKDDAWLTNFKIKGLGTAYRPSFQPQVVPDLKDKEVDYFQGVHGVYYYGDHDRLLPVQRVISEHFAGAVDHSFSLGHVYDLAPPGINKGTAVQEAGRLLRFDPATEAVAFGDGMNDLPMLLAVGRAYVMSNALPALLKEVGLEGTTVGGSAGTVELIASNDDDAVAKTIQSLLNLS